jgi:hypothetical protein
MLEFVLMIFLCRDLSKTAKTKGESGMGWVFRYLSLVFALYMTAAIVLLKYYGAGALEKTNVVIIVSVCGVAFDLLFYYMFKRRLLSMPDAGDDDEPQGPSNKDSNNNEKKDLSYFR